LLETIDWCMVLDHPERPKSVFALQKVLAERHHGVATQQPSWIQNMGQGLRSLFGR